MSRRRRRTTTATRAAATHGGGGVGFAIDHCDSLHLWNLELGESARWSWRAAAHGNISRLTLGHAAIGDWARRRWRR